MDQNKIFESIVSYLKVVHSPAFENHGWFKDEDVKFIKSCGFEVCEKGTGFYDGKILHAYDENISTYSAKCQCVHKTSVDRKYGFEFHVVEENPNWSSDPVFDSKGRRDIEGEKWVILTGENSETVELFENVPDIDDSIKELYNKLYDHIKENYKDLVLRLEIDLSE